MSSNLETLYSHKELPMTAPETDNKIALVVAAHPDDADFGAAGTSYLWSKEGWTLLLPRLHGRQSRAPPTRRWTRRTSSASAATSSARPRDAPARRTSSSSTTSTANSTYTRELLGDVVRHIRMLKPYAVFTHEPTAFIVRNSFVNHSDHRCTGPGDDRCDLPVCARPAEFPRADRRAASRRTT